MWETFKVRLLGKSIHGVPSRIGIKKIKTLNLLALNDEEKEMPLLKYEHTNYLNETNASALGT